MQKAYYFFHGNDHSRWKGGVHGYGEMKYTGLYPGIDLQVYSSGGNFKYDLEISAGADPGIIRLEYDGADSLYLFQDELHINALHLLYSGTQTGGMADHKRKRYLFPVTIF